MSEIAPFDRLQEILETMDVPELRKGDMKWLVRNLPIRNSEHPDLDEAKRLLFKLCWAK